MGAGGLATADMVLNIGPQHPATHGVLRLRVVLDGERIISAEPVIGYMHRGAEKLFEVRDYRQITVLANRHDWLSAFSNELGRRARRRGDARHGGARAGGLAAHPARRAQPGSLAPDVPRLLPARARRHHAGVLRVPRARGAAGRHGGGLRRPDALHVQPGRRPQGGRPRRLARPGRGGRQRGPAAAARARVAHRRQRDPRGPHPGRGRARHRPRAGPTASRARSRGPAASTSTCAATTPTSRTPCCSAQAAPAASSPAPPATAWRDSRCCSSRCTSASTSRRPASTCSGCCPPARSTSGCPRCSRCPRASATPPPRTRSASTATTWSRAARRRPWRLKLRSASFNNVQVLSQVLPGCLVADMVAVLGSMFFVVGDVDK